MQSLFDKQQLLLEAFQRRPYYDRPLYEKVDMEHRLIGLMGPRGVGKTTFLLKHILKKQMQQESALYVSVDHIFFLDHRLLDLVDWLYKETDVRLLCIDEIHKYPDWNQELKNIYDFYLDMKIVFSGSSMIDIARCKYDLSRRVILYDFYGLSFREYLYFKHNQKIEAITLSDLVQHHEKIAATLNHNKILKYFRDYLEEGYYPFFLEFHNKTNFFQAVENITQKIIYEDIASSHQLKTNTLTLMEKLFHYVICSPPGELSVYKLASHLQKDFESIAHYLQILNEAGLIRFLRSKKSGKAVLRNPEKMLPDNTVVMFATTAPKHDDDLQGKLREAFFLSQLQNSGHTVYLPAQGDFYVDPYHFEVGGKNKKFEQLKDVNNGFVVADSILVGHGATIPLYLFGFLY